MSLEVFGDGGDGEALADAVRGYGWDPYLDGMWCNEDLPGVYLTDEQMCQWLQDKRYGDQQDYAE